MKYSGCSEEHTASFKPDTDAQDIQQNGISQFAQRLIATFGQDEAIIVCQENHWFGALLEISNTKA